ncbi:MAG: hypothetical protein LBK07_03265 [Tannerella sp.]|jgi:hypothetical protein|nr:hypothetical protein [Tannerella sp.]
MKTYYDIRRMGAGIVFFFIFLFFCGCESRMPPLPGRVSLLDTIYKSGLTGYAIDSVYTELAYDLSGKNIRLKALRKGIIGASSGSNSVTWKSEEAVISYGSGYADIIYSYKGIRSEIVLNESYFAESVISRYSDGALHSNVDYTYNAWGYLDRVRVERPGQEAVVIIYKYPNPEAENVNDILIEEHPGPTVYRITLTAKGGSGAERQDNDAYVCNVLRFGNAPVTNEYVINPDLYYLGLYGIPWHHLPGEEVEKNALTGKPAVVRVGSHRYFY